MDLKPARVPLPLICYDARPVQPQTRHWGVGAFILNMLERLSGEFQFLGLARTFEPPDGCRIRSWPSIRKTQRLFFEVSPLLGGAFDLYWAANDFLPQLLRQQSVVTVHDLLPVNNMDGEERFTRFTRQRFISSLRRAGRILPNSRTTADDLLSLFPEIRSKVEVVPHGFEIPSPDGAEPVPLDEWTEGAPYLIMLGAHRPRKNLGLAVETAARLEASGARIPLLITGNVHQCFSSLFHPSPPGVKRMGVLPRQTAARLLRGALALLFPSRYEGFGLPILEAMAVGCPVLALDTPINRETAGGAAQFLPDDPAAWVNAVKALAASPSMRNEMIEKGRQNITRFSWAKTASTYGEIFRQVMG